MDPSRWKPECGSYRSDDGTRRVAVFYEDSDRDLRVEASIAIDRLPDFYDVPDHSLGAKSDRADKVLRAMLDQFLSQDPDIRPGELKRIGEEDVDVAPIINQFSAIPANEHLKAKRIDAWGFFNEEPIPCR